MRGHHTSRRILSIVALVSVMSACSGMWGTVRAAATSEQVPFDTWSLVAANGTLNPDGSVGIGTPSLALVVTGAAGSCTDGSVGTDDPLPCTIDLSISLTEVACGAGYGLGSSTATVTIGSDVDTYTFNVVVSAGAGAMEGSLNDDTTTFPAVAELDVTPSVSLTDSCLLGTMQSVTVSASGMGLL